MRVKSQYIDALCKEIRLQNNYLGEEPVKTIYFGGGTPSQLDAIDFEKIFNSFSENGYNLQTTEITLEANPDDINEEYLDSLKKLPFNRISLGVQSFDDDELKFLHRRHNAKTAINAVKLCQEAGFDNISIDLIYGVRCPSVIETSVIETSAMETWERSLQQALKLNVQHISAYSLTYEEGTQLFKMVESGKIEQIDDELSVSMLDRMISEVGKNGFEQYEISNFSKPGYRSKHNSSYWNGTHYLGLGASAHSYNGKTRQWNVSALKEYIQSIENDEIPAELEIISPQIAHNDFIITRLRTMEGMNLDELSELFGEKAKNRCLKLIESYLDNGMLILVNNTLKLSHKGVYISDSIMRDLVL